MSVKILALADSVTLAGRFCAIFGSMDLRCDPVAGLAPARDLLTADVYDLIAVDPGVSPGVVDGLVNSVRTPGHPNRLTPLIVCELDPGRHPGGEQGLAIQAGCHLASHSLNARTILDLAGHLIRGQASEFFSEYEARRPARD